MFNWLCNHFVSAWKLPLWSWSSSIEIENFRFGRNHFIFLTFFLRFNSLNFFNISSRNTFDWRACAIRKKLMSIGENKVYSHFVGKGFQFKSFIQSDRRWKKITKCSNVHVIFFFLVQKKFIESKRKMYGTMHTTFIMIKEMHYALRVRDIILVNKKIITCHAYAFWTQIIRAKALINISSLFLWMNGFLKQNIFQLSTSWIFFRKFMKEDDNA